MRTFLLKEKKNTKKWNPGLRRRVGAAGVRDGARLSNVGQGLAHFCSGLPSAAAVTVSQRTPAAAVVTNL